MGELGFNKIFGALLATLLFMMGLNEASTAIFGGEGGHHGEEHHASMNEWAAAKFHGYHIEIAEPVSGAAPTEEPEHVFDLDTMMASAEVTAGEQVMSSQCAACHTWDQGGADGLGPNLHGVMSRSIAGKSGFTYSGALSGVDGAWTVEEMNAWLTNPAEYAPGTSMGYQGLRSPRRDAERVNVIAYLLSLSE